MLVHFCLDKTLDKTLPPSARLIIHSHMWQTAKFTPAALQSCYHTLSYPDQAKEALNKSPLAVLASPPLPDPRFAGPLGLRSGELRRCAPWHRSPKL
jgi:hypothetical protein